MSGSNRRDILGRSHIGYDLRKGKNKQDKKRLRHRLLFLEVERNQSHAGAAASQGSKAQGYN
jgi:hypothetical protein